VSIKEKLNEARKSTKVAFIGGALVVAGTWGSCELKLGEEAPEAVEPAPAEQAEQEPVAEVEEAPGAEEAPQEETE
jgi:hypothetical protein